MLYDLNNFLTIKYAFKIFYSKNIGLEFFKFYFINFIILYNNIQKYIIFRAKRKDKGQNKEDQERIKNKICINNNFVI